MSDSARFLEVPKDQITDEFHVIQLDTPAGEPMLALGLGPNADEGYLLVGTPDDFDEVIAALQLEVARARGEENGSTHEPAIVHH